MGWSQVVLITAFVVLLQGDVHLAASCSNRKTVVLMRMPRKTNVTVKYPPKSDPVKFVPYPDNEDKNNEGCYICNGPQCRECTAADNQSPPSASSFIKSPQRTNIIIDLNGEEQQNKQKPTTGTGNSSSNGKSDDGTLVVVQDSLSASGVSKSAASDISKSGGQAATSSASAVKVSDSDVIALLDENSPDGKSGNNTQDIYVQEDSQSIAGSTAVSNVKTKPNPVPIPASPPDDKSKVSQ